MLFIVIISLLGCVVVYLVGETFFYNINRIKLTKAKTALFIDRDSRRYTEIYEIYFSDTEITYDEFYKVWRDIGDVLFVDPRYLLPEDALSDLRVADCTSSLVKIDLEEKLDNLIFIHTVVGRGLEKPLVQPKTIRDIVYLCLGRSIPDVHSM